MEMVAIVAVLALLQYLGFAFAVGGARARYEVRAPATSGHPVFERYYRVQQNTLEQLVAFVPGLWLFGLYVDPRWAGGIGLLFVVGRWLYFRAYVRDPAKRGPGFGLSLLATTVLLVGAAVGAGLRLAGG